MALGVAFGSVLTFVRWVGHYKAHQTELT
jgi:hypothetical protein